MPPTASLQLTVTLPGHMASSFASANYQASFVLPRRTMGVALKDVPATGRRRGETQCMNCRSVKRSPV